MALNILLVDDSRTLRAVIEKTLQIAGVSLGEVFHAANGREALDVLDDHWIDVIFADIHMPVMDGNELVNELEKSDLLESIPVIVVSTEGSTTRIEHLKSQGIRAYLRKPFNPEQCREIIHEVLGFHHE